VDEYFTKNSTYQNQQMQALQRH
jgi:hypothetical protein